MSFAVESRAVGSRTVTTGAVLRRLALSIVSATLCSCSSQGGDNAPDAGAGGDLLGGSGGASAGGTLTGGTPGGGAVSTGGAGLGGGAGTAGEAIVGISGAGAGGSAGTAGASGGSGGAGPIAPCSPPVDTKRPAERLSETGCMDPTDIRKMASFVIPYDVNSPLWSDAAVKTRGMVIPEGQKIHARNCSANPDDCPYGPEDDGRWVFPVGTVLVKNFLFDDKLVETRLFVRPDSKSWVGYGYQWNEEQTEATVVPNDGATVTFNTGQREVEWAYPSRYDCMLCHNRQGGYVLGPETRQLDRMTSDGNLLDKLEGLALFDAPLPKPHPAPLDTPYASFEGQPREGATLEELARSYLHANCSFCHRADGNPGTLDLRFGVPLKDMNACNVQPQKGGAGLSVYTILTPGKPEESVLWARMQTLDDMARMPQIGTYVVDEPGVQLISDWISSLTGCE